MSCLTFPFCTLIPRSYSSVPGTGKEESSVGAATDCFDGIAVRPESATLTTFQIQSRMELILSIEINIILPVNLSTETDTKGAPFGVPPIETSLQKGRSRLPASHGHITGGVVEVR